MDKIDIHYSSQKCSKMLVFLKKDISSKNYDLIKTFLEAAAIGKTARKGKRGKQVGLRGQLKYMFTLKVVAKYFDKDLSKITLKEMEAFIKDLNENKLRKQNGSPYSEQTKSDIKVTFIAFLRYTLKDSKRFTELTDWIDISYKKKEIPSLTEEEVHKMLNKCITLKQKVLVALLFDTGARVEEFLNFRMGDITEVKEAIPYYKVTIKNEYSKTLGRTISLFWKPTTDILKEWLEQNSNTGMNEPLFSSTYGAVRMMLYKIGNRSLKRNVNPHLLRHSSATYYAGKGYSYFEICKRYGWEIGSKTPYTYIDRSGINEQGKAKEYINENLQDLKGKIEVIQREKIIQKEEYNNKIDILSKAVLELLREKTKSKDDSKHDELIKELAVLASYAAITSDGKEEKNKLEPESVEEMLKGFQN